jgi:hypothetical protein
MARRILFGTLWFVVIAVGTILIGGAIAGGAALAKNPSSGSGFREGFEDGSQVGAEAGAEFRARYRWPIFGAAAIIAAAGTAAGFLPGTKR